MKVIRRRNLFYKRRYSNLYRLFGLMAILAVAVYLTVGLGSGTVQNPFTPTPTLTRSAFSLEQEADAIAKVLTSEPFDAP